MAEWSMAAVLKTVRGATPSWVRILLPPPCSLQPFDFFNSIPGTLGVCSSCQPRIGTETITGGPPTEENNMVCDGENESDIYSFPSFTIKCLCLPGAP